LSLLSVSVKALLEFKVSNWALAWISVCLRPLSHRPRLILPLKHKQRLFGKRNKTLKERKLWLRLCFRSFNLRNQNRALRFNWYHSYSEGTRFISRHANPLS
jgi:hypothetical protein